MDETSNPLGERLRALRESVTPDDIGIANLGKRRTPGVRREEVAILAGISADYYLRLERGRDPRPSADVIEAIGRALRLDDEDMAALKTFVTDAPRRQGRRPVRERAATGPLKLLDSVVQPAFIEGRHFDVLASNRLARALSPRLAAGRNQLRDIFLDPAERALYLDWEAATESFVVTLRQSVGDDIDDPRFIKLAGELSLASARFRTLWGRDVLRRRRGAPVRIDHPQVGELSLRRERLAIDGVVGQVLVIYHADGGLSDAEKLALLASADSSGEERS